MGLFFDVFYSWIENSLIGYYWPPWLRSSIEGTYVLVCFEALGLVRQAFREDCGFFLLPRAILFMVSGSIIFLCFTVCDIGCLERLNWWETPLLSTFFV